LLRVRLREELRAIQRRVRITAIFVTHDQEEALSLADRIAVMNKGQVEQLDKPANIYANPRTLFVADFIGTMNLLPATCQAGRLHLGAHTLAAPAGLSAGTPATIAIRPEDLALVANSAAMPTDAWAGSVFQSMDLGHYRRAIVDVPTLGKLKVYLAKSVTLNEGDSVQLAPMRYLVYAANQAPVAMQQQPVEGVLVYQ
jgi:putative spermidine/putrescine transport system ATP-binding protein